MGVLAKKFVKITKANNKEFGQDMFTYGPNINIAPNPLPDGVIARVPLPLASKYPVPTPAEIAASGMTGGSRRRRTRRIRRQRRKSHRRR